MSEAEIAIRIENLTMAYGSFVVMRELNFTIRKGSIFLIMGGSGCGKSTLMRHMVGLKEPAEGYVYHGSENFTTADEETRKRLGMRCGVMFQGGALWSSMTLAQNVALPLSEYTKLSKKEINELVDYKLALVGLRGFEGYYPSEISGGMRKRAGLARAMALDPDVLFFDEPSAGLDPLSAKRLDDLIQELSKSLGTTFIVVTHELASIHSIGTDGVFLDADTRKAIAYGGPKQMMEGPDKVRKFLQRET